MFNPLGHCHSFSLLLSPEHPDLVFFVPNILQSPANLT